MLPKSIETPGQLLMFVIGRMMSLFASLLFFHVLTFVKFILGQKPSQVQEYANMFSALYAVIDPTFIVLLWVTLIRLQEKKVMKYVIMAVFLVPIIEQAISVIENSTRELYCSTQVHRDALRKMHEFNARLFEKVEKNILEIAKSSTDIEGSIIERYLIFQNAMREEKEDIKEQVRRMKLMESNCTKFLANFANKKCNKGLESVNKELDNSNIIKIGVTYFIRPVFAGAVKKGCKKVDDMKKRNNPCNLNQKLLQKMEDFVKEKQKESDPKSSDVFDFEIISVNKLDINDEVMDELLSPKLVVSGVNMVTSFLMDMKRALLELLPLMICLGTFFIMRKLQTNPEYCNTLVTQNTTSSDSVTNPVLPLRKTDLNKFSEKLASVNIKKILKPANLFWLGILPGLPFLHDFLLDLASKRLYIVPSVLENDAMQRCLDNHPIYTGGGFPHMYLWPVFAFHIVFIILDATWGENLEGYIFTKINPGALVFREIALLNMIKKHRQEDSRVPSEEKSNLFSRVFLGPLVTCNICYKHIFLWHRYCADPCCGNLLCHSCSCHDL